MPQPTIKRLLQQTFRAFFDLEEEHLLYMKL